jgi:hypothetical protein
MMIDALNAIITRHFDMREEIASKLSSVKLEDINDLKAKGISYFRVGETFTYQGIKYSIGTSFNRDAKLGQIEKAISICNEDPKNFIIEGLKISDSNGNRISSKKSSVKRDFLND